MSGEVVEGGEMNTGEMKSEVQPEASARRSAYHHGDLPGTLMDLGVQHIAREGIEKLSLRALAREAGVSPTAPYRHFPTRLCLLAGIATRGFKRLTERMRLALQDSADPNERFVKFGQAYLDFASEEPVSYELMFGGIIEFDRYPMLHEAAEASFGQLLEVLRNTVDASVSDEEIQLLAGSVWAGVHGLAALLISKLRTRRQTANRSSAVAAIDRLAAEPERALQLLLGSVLRSHT